MLCMTLLTEHRLWSYYCYKSFCVISFNPDISPIRKGINIIYDAHFLQIRNETEELKQPFQGHTTIKRQSQNSTAKSLTPKPARFPGGKTGWCLQKGRSHRSPGVAGEECLQSQRAEAPGSALRPPLSHTWLPAHNCVLLSSQMPHSLLVTNWLPQPLYHCCDSQLLLILTFPVSQTFVLQDSTLTPSSQLRLSWLNGKLTPRSLYMAVIFPTRQR